MAERRRSTATTTFGTSSRESHDASAFYARFTPPVLSDDTEVIAVDPTTLAQQAVLGSSTDMSAVLPDKSVALVVTSPPYFVGKEYEDEVLRAAKDSDPLSVVPGSYREYLDMLHAVFAECARVLEPGGRIAINVANLGRKPYRSLSSDVIRILEDLGLLLRGEIIWQKGKTTSGSCAWGSFKSPANPVLRDTTERVIVASKGRFDRALSQEERRKRGLPHLASTN
ncbi:MAG: DNA-methyltransferase, partial [Acidimicrobiales bacterium]